MNLDDLRAWSNEMLNSQGGHYRDVTLDDLIAVLEGMGAWTVKSPISGDIWNSQVFPPGTYLVLPLPTPQEEK